MSFFIWSRIIITSIVILIINKFYSEKNIVLSLTLAMLFIIANPLNFNLASLELLYYFTLTLFINYQIRTEQKLKRMEEERKSNFAKARKIHQNSLPNNLPEKADLSIAAFYQPAEELGGDYYNVFKVDHGSMDVFFDQYFIYMFDVSGHGIDSAMLSIFINNTIEDYFKLRHNQGEKVSPKQILDYIDEQYRAENYPDDYLICLLVGVLDLNNYQFTYSSSGFQFPFYKVNKQGQLDELEAGGLPISSSIDKSFIELRENTVKLEKNELMFFTTDGLVEQVIDSDRYGGKIINKLTNIDYFHPAFLIESIKKDFVNFNGSKYGDDDITFLSIGRLNSELKKWTFKTEQSNLQDNKKEIFRYLAEVALDTTYIPNVLERLIELAWNKTNQFSIKILTTNDYLMLSLTTSNFKSSWQKLLAENIYLNNLGQYSIDIFPCNKNSNTIYVFKSVN